MRAPFFISDKKKVVGGGHVEDMGAFDDDVAVGASVAIGIDADTCIGKVCSVPLWTAFSRPQPVRHQSNTLSVLSTPDESRL